MRNGLGSPGLPAVCHWQVRVLRWAGAMLVHARDFVAEGERAETRKTKRWVIAAAALSLLYFAVLAYYAQVRGLDPDEGFYPLAARLVWEGKVPYHDFLFSQGALVPYLYSWVWAVHPQSLVSMRMLSVALGAMAVFLWGVFLFSIRRLPAKIALAAFLIVCLNPYWIAWHTVVKTFAVADLLMSGAMVCFYVGFQSGRAKWFFAAGALLGVCVSARALYGPLIPFVLLWMAYLDWKERKPPSFARSLAYLGGALCGVMPMVFSFASDPRAFVFNNIQYRQLLDLWVSTTLAQSLRLYRGGIHGLALRGFFLVELLLAAMGAVTIWKHRKTADSPYTRQEYLYFQLAFLMMLVYCATSLTPLPMFAQYFDGPLLPFLILFIAEGLRVVFQVRRGWVAALVAIVIPALFWHDVGLEVDEFSSRRLRMSSYREVAETVRANSGENATVLSIWPGYVFESGRQCFPGGENEFVYQVARVVSPEARSRFHLISGAEVLRAVSTGAPDIYIPAAFFRYLAFTMSQADRQALQSAVDANYVLVKKIDDIEIYRLRSKILH